MNEPKFEKRTVVEVIDGGMDFSEHDRSGQILVAKTFDHTDNSWSCYVEGEAEARSFWIDQDYLRPLPVVSDEEVQTAVESIQASAQGVPYKTTKHCPTCTCGQP